MSNDIPTQYKKKIFCNNCTEYFEQIFRFGQIASNNFSCPNCGVKNSEWEKAKMAEAMQNAYSKEITNAKRTSESDKRNAGYGV